MMRQLQHQQEDRRRQEQSSIEEPNILRWSAIVPWDPHLYPPTHGYYLLKDRQGHQRVVKAETLLPANNTPRQYPRKLRFVSAVGVRIIPRKDDPINADAWNREYRRNVALNNQWQQHEWQLEAEARRAFRRTVVSALVDHGQTLRMRWHREKFRRSVVRAIVDQSHRLRWNWALQDEAKTNFRRTVLAGLVNHGQTLRMRWHKEKFSRTVVVAMVDYSHRLRYKWALRHHAKAKFQQAVLGYLAGHCQMMRLKWCFKATFRHTVVASMVDHSHRLRWKWALQHAHDEDHLQFTNRNNGDTNDMHETDPGQTEDDDADPDIDDFFNDDDDDRIVPTNIDDDDDGDDDDIFNSNDGDDDADADDADADAGAEYDEVDDDEDNNPVLPPTTTPTTTRPRQRRAAKASEATTDGGTVWVDGLRRSARFQPLLGSLYENGRRRSARFL
jgi:hypothetical protein